MISVLIPIDLGLEEFKGFFCSYLLKGKHTYLIDVGPRAGARSLLRGLKELGAKDIDYVLLTHIHIDHGGAIQEILDTYPNAKVVCHQMGVEFLCDPDRIWGPSQKVLKKRAMEYGKPGIAPRSRVLGHREVEFEDVLILETPGHAPHHLSFVTDEEIFSGEAGGNHFIVDGHHYLRPATPPRFLWDVAVRSVELLASTNKETICYAHCGKATGAQGLLHEFRDQLYYWKDVIAGVLRQGVEDHVGESIERLIEEDYRLRGFKSMPKIVQEREREFITNSVNGFIGYLKEKGISNDST